MTPDRFIAAAFREWADRKKGAGLPEDDIIYSIEQKAAELARESVGDGELLPCPFCGKAPRMFIGYKADYDVKILCDWCGAEGATFGGDDFKGAERQLWINNAITAWNTRASKQEFDEAEPGDTLIYQNPSLMCDGPLIPSKPKDPDEQPAP